MDSIQFLEENQRNCYDEHVLIPEKAAIESDLSDCESIASDDEMFEVCLSDGSFGIESEGNEIEKNQMSGSQEI